MKNRKLLAVGTIIALGALSLTARHPSDYTTLQVVLNKIEDVLLEYQTGNLEPTAAIRKISNIILAHKKDSHPWESILQREDDAVEIQGINQGSDNESLGYGFLI